MKIIGGNSYITFDLGNGYVLRAQGEMLIGKRFVVYVNSMKSWEEPHEKEEVTKEQVKCAMNEKTIQIIFE